MIAVELLPERNCSTCTAGQKVQWGCHGPPKEKLTLDGKPVDRCPRRGILDDPHTFGRIFSMYRWAQKGYLPERGGLEDQPGKLMACFEVIDRALDFCEAEQKAREEAKQRRRAKAKGR